MSISSVQYRKKKKEYAEALCKKGISPNSFELNRMLSEYFDVHTMGMPSYAPIKQKPYEESSKDDYNHNFSTFGDDIDTIYQANIEANNKAVAIQEYYDTEKIRVMNAIARLSLRVDNIMEAIKSSSTVKQYVETFDDLYGVEFYGDIKRNIPYTSAFVDLLQKTVYIDKTKSKVNKILIQGATIDINGFNGFTSHQSEGDIKKILNDTLDEMYIIYGKSQLDGEKKITIDIDLGKIVTFNTVMFKYASTRVMPCELLLSDDGENYVPVYDVTNRDYIEWNFNLKSTRYIRIICHKTEPDGVSSSSSGEATEYDYNFIFKNISIAKEEFGAKAVLVSKVIDFDDLVSTVKLDASDMTFNHTRIDYFIGFDNGIDKIGWDAIENHKDYQLFMFEKRHKILNAHIDGFGHQGEILNNLYRLYKIPDGTNRNSIKLTAGYNMWHVKRYNRKSNTHGGIDGVADNDDGFSINSGDFSKHIARCNMTNMFMDCENYDRFQISTNVLYIFTQYVSLKSSKNLFDTFVKVTNAVDSADPYNKTELRVFLNGYEITADDNGRYSFAMKRGVNKVQIAVYCPSDNALTKFFCHNVNFKALTNDVFACTPMKYTNNTILNRMPGDSYEYYTIKDDYIYVKCDPDNMIKSEIEDMGYFCSYYALRDDMRDYFPDSHLKFRIMAVMHSDDRNVSPEICNFRITGR